MLGLGGSYYWRKKDGGKMRGIVVVFAWMCSEERLVKNYVELYSSLGWDSFVCHAGCLNMFVPTKATSLAFDVLNELVKELEIRPCPLVLASFSGGPKACMYKLLQIIEGKCEAEHYQADYQLVKDCIAGYIYDSSPTDFYSDLALEFFFHPSVLKTPHPPRLLSWIGKSVASGLDALFIGWSESQRAEYWQTLYASASMGAPYLILCSENDDLASYETICNFVQRLQKLQANVKLVKWKNSPHVGHYRIYPDEYKAAVTELLDKAAIVYSRKFPLVEGDGLVLEGVHEGISRPIYSKSKAAASSSQSFQGLALELDEQLLPSSKEHHEGQGIKSERSKHEEGNIHLSKPLSINAYGVLGQILFDAYVPMDVEEWDIRPSSSSNDPPSFSPIKCIRSRL